MEVWDAYVATFGGPPSNPTQLLNFSKRDKTLPNLSFVQARALFQAREEKDGGEDGGNGNGSPRKEATFFYSSTSKSPQQPSPTGSGNNSRQQSPKKKPPRQWPPRRQSSETRFDTPVEIPPAVEQQPPSEPQPQPVPVIEPEPQEEPVPQPQPEPEPPAPEPEPTQFVPSKPIIQWIRDPTPEPDPKPQPEPQPVVEETPATEAEPEPEPEPEPSFRSAKFGRQERPKPRWETEPQATKSALSSLRTGEDDEDEDDTPTLVNSQSDTPKQPSPRRKSSSKKSSSRPGSRRGSRQLEECLLEPHANRRYRLKDGRIGVIKFMGRTQFGKASETWLGMVIEHGEGRHNGTVQGRRYFRCRDGKGVFVRPAALMDDLGSERLPITQEMLDEVPIQDPSTKSPKKRKSKSKSRSRSNSPRGEGHTRQKSYHVPKWDDYKENHGDWLSNHTNIYNPKSVLNKNKGVKVEKKKTVEEIGVTTHWIGPQYEITDRTPEFVEDWIAEQERARQGEES